MLKLLLPSLQIFLRYSAPYLHIENLQDEELTQWWWSFAKVAAEEGTLVALKPEVMGTSIQDINKVVAFHASGKVCVKNFVNLIIKKVSGFRPVIKLL